MILENGHLKINEVHQGDCLELMNLIPDKSIDAIISDLPYGTTACKWDTIIPFEPLWEQYKRIIKDNGAIVLTASQPFTSALVMSNIKDFRYSLVWLKKRPSNVFNARKMFMKWHEDVLVFYNKLPKFYPQMVAGKVYKKKHVNIPKQDSIYGKTGVKQGYVSENNGLFYPKTVMEISNDNHNSLHPTQKPVALFEYLVKTYTNEGDIVLDNTAGSCTTAIACIRTKRNYICIEQDENYCEVGIKRIEDELRQKPLL
jgi:site-specific DNA-methyltransferase (adenine-specific)